MGKKKYVKSSSGFGNPSELIKQGVDVIDRYLAEKKFAKALNKLEELLQRYPQNPEILEMGMRVFRERNDRENYLDIAEKLVRVAPDRPHAINCLADAYLKNFFPCLALETFEQLIEKFPDNARVEDAKKALIELDELVNELLTDLKLTKNDFPLVVLHEKSQKLLRQRKNEEAVATLEELINIAPNFLPAFNNLSLIYGQQEKLEEAIAISQKVLAINPDNAHALSNLVHYYLRSGDIETAKEYVKKLKILPNDQDSDIYLKKAEAFSYLREDIAIIALGEEAKKNNLDLKPLFWHLLAVAYGNKGNTLKANELWEEALDELLDFELIEENLDNINLGVGERTTPWAFELNQWLAYKYIKDFGDIISEKNKNKQKQLIEGFLEKSPQILPLIPILLDRGSPMAKQFVLSLASISQNSELLQAVKEFTLGDRGSDEERVQAGKIALNAGLIEPGEVKMWIKGEWQDFLIMGMEISDEPHTKHKSKKVINLLREGILALKAGEGEKAESILKEALSLEPNAPDIKYNLAGAYQQQDREEEAAQLVKQIHEEHPDYAFATIALARQAIEEKNLEEADGFLQPLLKRQKFHFQEFGQLCQVQIELAVARKKTEVANSWLQMWEQVEPDSGRLFQWRQRLKGKTQKSPFEL